MANVTRVRVEVKQKFNDPVRNLKAALEELRKQVGRAKVLIEYKEHQAFVSKSEKERHKRRDSKKKLQMQSIETRILAGEKVKAPAGVVKKIMSNLNKDKKDRKKERRLNRNDQQ